MLPGAPEGARWVRDEPRRTLPSHLLTRMVRSAFPQGRVLKIEPLADGFRNSNFKLRIASLAEPLVLRIYEHDPTLCQKEVDLLRLVGRSVPVPEVLHAAPLGTDDLPPFALLRYVEGITFRELRRGRDPEAIAQAAYSAGETLAAIHRIVFPKPGWLAPGPTVTTPLLAGPNAMARFVDLCLASVNLQRRLLPAVCEGIHVLMWSDLSELARFEQQTSLVHGDFGKRNVLVRQATGRWAVAAVLDWEFAVSSAPITDLANFLRYERASRPSSEPYFSNGYLQAEGSLPEDWRRLSRLIDLVALCEALTRDSLRDDVIVELAELVRATVERRDPEFPQ
ncbi:MAG TPA: phosphotransferase [Bryobacteraceae bacterium]|jgi:aminoglycoside phosphotransferase (APT) family kinase protein|nr:phosphotransferase [Bryobacteraceae bacterium]